jgi:hypothetical protein
VGRHLHVYLEGSQFESTVSEISLMGYFITPQLDKFGGKKLVFLKDPF